MDLLRELVDQKSGSSHPRNAPEYRMKMMIVFNGSGAEVDR
jgi:hypothetical protein